MKIGLWSDSHNFPSLPMMKLSAYHKSIGDDVEMLDSGLLIRKSEADAGKTIYYCPACYQKEGKLFSIVKGAMARDRFCSNCRMHYNLR